MLKLIPARCCICDTDASIPAAMGEDFEYRTSPDTFRAVRCRQCGVIYLNPRPADEELPRIYPATYHAFNFSAGEFGLVYRIRRQLEARRVLSWCGSLPPAARILDVGCGDGFHLGILRDFGDPRWRLEGADADSRASQSARANGLTVHQGKLEELDLPPANYDLVLLIMTIEHVADPRGLLMRIGTLLRPGGAVVVVTDNTDSLDCKLFGRRHWGGYHFPRHWYLFNRGSLAALAGRAGLEVYRMSTVMTPVNWIYSIHNLLADWGAPRWLTSRFQLNSFVSLSVFTLWDRLMQLCGKGGILQAILRKPPLASV